MYKRTQETAAKLRAIGYTYELVIVTPSCNMTRSYVSDLGDFTSLCRKANELNNLDFDIGLHYYVRAI
jgi:hypothetical protein